MSLKTLGNGLVHPQPGQDTIRSKINQNHKESLIKPKAIGHQAEIGRIGVVPTTSEVSEGSRDIK